MVDIREKNGNAVFMVRVQPRSSKSMICGLYNGGLKVSLKAAPVDDAANEECIRLFSGLFRVPVSRVQIVSGKTSRTKRMMIEGVDSGTAASVLGNCS
ncbi:MAG: DUF167 domain-containing protein [Chlorobiaceae bacterium]|nr:DUF167 domain-containing protein [Chlorobiaceae bacterium]NTV59723.1 DUF167 domain-containing protein [Chlorobiaceae bacterium]